VLVRVSSAHQLKSVRPPANLSQLRIIRYRGALMMRRESTGPRPQVNPDFLRKWSDDRLVVPLRNDRELVHMRFPRLRDRMHIAKKLFMSTRRRHQQLSRDAFADVGKAVDASFGNRYSGTWTHVFDLVADNVLQSAL
jgi:hypothetical protein